MERSTVNPRRDVWILDDEEELTEICARVLESKYLTRKFTSPLALLQEIEKGFWPDALVVDIRLPQMDGLSLVDNLRARGLEIPTVMISGNADTDKLTRALNLRVESFVAKPFDNAHLQAEVDRVTEFDRRAKRPLEVVEQVYEYIGIARELLDRYFLRAAIAENRVFELGAPLHTSPTEVKQFIENLATESELEMSLEMMTEKVECILEGRRRGSA